MMCHISDSRNLFGGTPRITISSEHVTGSGPPPGVISLLPSPRGSPPRSADQTARRRVSTGRRTRAPACTGSRDSRISGSNVTPEPWRCIRNYVGWLAATVLRRRGAVGLGMMEAMRQ